MTDEMKSDDATRYLVVAMDNDGFKTLAVESSEGAARKVAEARAMDDGEPIIGVYQKIGTARMQRSVAWKGVA